MTDSQTASSISLEATTIEIDSSIEKTMNEKAISSSSSNTLNGQLDPGPPLIMDQDVVTLPFKELMVIFVGLMLGVFLSSLDQTIVSVCTTTIANEFHSLSEVSWVATAYLLTSTSFQPM